MGAISGPGIMERQEWIGASALSCFLKGSEGKVRPESSEVPVQQTVIIRIMPYMCILLSRL